MYRMKNHRLLRCSNADILAPYPETGNHLESIMNHRHIDSTAASLQTRPYAARGLEEKTARQTVSHVTFSDERKNLPADALCIAHPKNLSLFKAAKMSSTRTSRAARFANTAALLIGMIGTALIATAPATAASSNRHNAQSVARATPKEAKLMLDAAAEYLGTQPQERAYAAFNNQKGRFLRGDLNVFVVGLDGVMHADGSAPEALVGTNVTDLRDASGKQVFRELLEKARTADSGSVENVWLNRVSNRIEDRTVHFRRVGDNVVAVGSYAPRSSAEQAQSLLEIAVIEIGKSGPDAAFSEFNKQRGRFVRDDLYVFVVGLNDARFYATGATPEMVGKDVGNLRNVEGRPIIREMVELAKAQDNAVYEYEWRNPATNKVEKKHTLIQRIDGYLVGVGYYSK